jgi:hypothetical protein
MRPSVNVSAPDPTGAQRSIDVTKTPRGKDPGKQKGGVDQTRNQLQGPEKTQQQVTSPRKASVNPAPGKLRR